MHPRSCIIAIAALLAFAAEGSLPAAVVDATSSSKDNAAVVDRVATVSSPVSYLEAGCREAARKCSVEGKSHLQRVSIADLDAQAEYPRDLTTFPRLLIRSLQQDHVRLQI